MHALRSQDDDDDDDDDPGDFDESEPVPTATSLSADPGERPLGIMAYRRVSKTGPMWPASAAKAVDWPRLAGAWISLGHSLALNSPPESQLAEA